MKVKLYKNCIVNKNYDEIFRTKEIINEYLETLVSFDFIIENAYTPLNGRLTFENENPSNFNLFECNYITFDENGIYAFINNVAVINGLIVVDYVCDYWHTFSDKMTMRESLMSRSLLTNNLDYFFTPIDITNIDSLKFEKVSNGTLVGLVLELQLYNLAKGGDLKSSETHFLYIGTKGDENESINAKVFKNVSYTYIYQILNEITLCQPQTNKNTLISSQKNVDFNIVNAYIIPEEYTDYLKSDDTQAFLSVEYSENKTYFLWALKNLNSDDLRNPNNFLKYTIGPELNIKSYGFYSLQIPYNYNGQDYEFTVSFNTSQYNFNIILNGACGKRDITELFETDLNFNVVDAATLAQQKIARKTETTQGILGVVNNSIKVAQGAVSGGSALFSGAQAATSSMAPTDASVSGMISATNALTGSVGTISSGISGIISSSQRISNANAKKFNNTSYVDNVSTANLNAFYGFGFLYSEQPINLIFVNQLINESGYIVEKITNDIDITRVNEDYNVIKFDFVRISCCSDNIANVIRSILLNGVKIWYKVPK